LSTVFISNYLPISSGYLKLVSKPFPNSEYIAGAAEEKRARSFALL